VASKFSSSSYILKYICDFSIGNYETKNSNSLMSEYGRMSVLSVITRQLNLPFFNVFKYVCLKVNILVFKIFKASYYICVFKCRELISSYFSTD
jgi:hypothetical protein